MAIQDEYGQQIVVSGKAPLNNAVAKSLDERYHAAYDAPISSRQPFHNLGHLAHTISAEALLRGDYTWPEKCEEATEAILQEIVLRFSQQQSPIPSCIAPRNFHWWRISRKKTESL